MSQTSPRDLTVNLVLVLPESSSGCSQVDKPYNKYSVFVSLLCHPTSPTWLWYLLQCVIKCSSLLLLLFLSYFFLPVIISSIPLPHDLHYLFSRNSSCIFRKRRCIPWLLESEENNPHVIGQLAWHNPFTDCHGQIQLSEMSARNPLGREQERDFCNS